MDKKKKAGYGGLGAAPLCILAMVALVLLVLLLLIIYFSFLKPRDPSLTTDCILLQAPNPRPTAAVLLASVLCINATLHNPNKAAFVYESVAASMAYKGRQVGFLMMPGGAARAGSGIRFTICLSPGAGQSFLSDAAVQHDAAAYQMVSVTTRLSLSGDVTVLGSFSHGTGASSNCIVSISARSQQVVAYNCGDHL